MNLLYIGAGFVGACSAAVSANSGHRALVYDINEVRVNMLNSGDRDTIESCLHEKGLGDLLVKHKDLITFTTDYKKVESFLDTCDAIFMCLPTPEIAETGESNLSYYFAAAETLAEAMKKRNNSEQSKYIIVINKSTVPIDMIDRTLGVLKEHGVKNAGTVSNPEFLVEGTAVRDSLSPDRVVIGANSQKDFDIARRIYQRFYDAPGVQYIEVNPKEAAAGKLLANYYLYHKLMACYDVIGRTCEAFEDLSFENVRKILTSDDRIGSWGFYNSLYAGGSCLIKDARSLSHQLQTAGKGASLVDEISAANKRQLELFLSRAKNEANFDWKDKVVGLVGLSFKRDTNDIRNAASIEIAKFLSEKGIKRLQCFDPVAGEHFQTLYPISDSVVYESNEHDAMKGADVVIIATDWPQFRGLGDVLLYETKKPILIMDGRRMLQHRYADLQKEGYDIIGVGSRFLKGKK